VRKYDETEKEELVELNASPWQIKLLKMNPEYNYWGNFEDYMSTKDSGQWSEPIEINSASELWEQDELNMVANFYFDVSRASCNCEECEQTGYNRETKKLSQDWYSFDNEDYRPNPYKSNAIYNNNAWQHHLAQVEVDALWKDGRLSSSFKEQPTAQEVNEWNLKEIMGHDAINQYICVKARAEDQGVYGLCEKCNGKGYIYESDTPTISLQLWMLHPRKGSSRGLFLRDFKREEVRDILKYLYEARERNMAQFSKVPDVI